MAFWLRDPTVRRVVAPTFGPRETAKCYTLNKSAVILITTFYKFFFNIFTMNKTFKYHSVNKVPRLLFLWRQQSTLNI